MLNIKNTALFFFLITPMIDAEALSIVRIVDYNIANGMLYSVDYSIDYIDNGNNIPNPCYKKEYICEFGLTSVYYKGDPMPGEMLHNSIEINDYPTLNEIVSAYKKKYPLPYRADLPVTPYADPENVCIGLALSYTYRSEKQWYPGTICRHGPPINLSCNIEGDIEMNYGSLTNDNINNKRITTTASLTCNKNATLNAMVTYQHGTDFISLRDNDCLVSKLEVNNKDGIIGDSFNVIKDQPKTIQLSSILTKKCNIEAGPFRGSASLAISYE